MIWCKARRAASLMVCAVLMSGAGLCWAAASAQELRAMAQTEGQKPPAAPTGSEESASKGPQNTTAGGRSARAVGGRPESMKIELPVAERGKTDTTAAVRIVLALTLIAVIPSIAVCVTAFLRIVVVLSMLRHAIGMPETPPNTVVIGLALFLTLFTMNPVLQQVNAGSFQPFMAGKIGVPEAMETGVKPLRDFMIRQTREQDLALMIDVSKESRPQSIDEVGNIQLIPAFMLSELRAAFEIGFVIFLPFLLIDLIVSSILMSLGMMMMPPTTISLPIKILMFVLVDGWSLIVKALVGSFH